MFQERTVARKLQLRRELASLKMGASESVETYLMRAENIRVQMENAGLAVSDEEMLTCTHVGTVCISQTYLDTATWQY